MSQPILKHKLCGKQVFKNLLPFFSSFVRVFRGVGVRVSHYPPPDDTLPSLVALPYAILWS